MPIISTNCPNCGASMQVESSIKSVICKYCNSSYLIEQAVNNYYTNVINSSSDNADDLFSACIKFIRDKKWGEAQRYADMLLQRYPSDYRGFYSMVLVITKNLCEYQHERELNMVVYYLGNASSLSENFSRSKELSDCNEFIYRNRKNVDDVIARQREEEERLNRLREEENIKFQEELKQRQIANRKRNIKKAIIIPTSIIVGIVVIIILINLSLNYTIKDSSYVAQSVYYDAESFEMGLNKGANLEGVEVTFKVVEISPYSVLGYNIWGGEHLNFVSDGRPDIIVYEGDTITVKVTEIKKKVGSWVIKYEDIRKESE